MFARWHDARRRRQCAAQWLECCQVLANALRAGCNLEQAIQCAAEEIPAPLGPELQRVCQAMAVGQGIEAALAQLTQRIPGETTQTIVQTMTILHATGGNLIAAFDRVVAAVRRQRHIADRIDTATLQGRVTAIIVAAVPVAQLGVVACFAPHLVASLWTTPLGWCCVAAAVLLQLVGACWIRAILRIRI